MLTKFIELTTWKQVMMLIFLNIISSITLILAMMFAWNQYALIAMLSVMGFIYFALWSMILIRAKFERNTKLFVGSFVYWSLLIVLSVCALVGVIPTNFILIILTGSFSGLVLLGTFVALIPVAVFGIGITIWLWIQANKLK